jgi:prepilin-type N-terminal cleavage/methylation domain-containing protein
MGTVMMHDRVRGEGAACGFSLIETLLVLAIAALMTAFANDALIKLVGRARLEASAWHLWSALGHGRSEAMYSGRPVHVCGLSMRRHQRLLGCRQASAGNPWRQGVLLFADRPGQGHLAEHYDHDEDLRDFAVVPGVRLRADAARYVLAPSGSDMGAKMPFFALQDPLGDACQTLRLDPVSARATWCRGAACPGCA